MFDIPGAFAVRSPSRSWPDSYLKHFYSCKFAKLLAIHNPKLYLSISGIDIKSEIGMYILAQHAKKRMGG
jgi:hypothetical protein